MNRFCLPLAATLCLLASCQGPQHTAIAPQPDTLSRIEPSTPQMQPPPVASVNYLPKPTPFGEVKALARQQMQVKFTYPAAQNFGTQAFGCGEVAYASVSVSGPALGAATLYANGSDATYHMFDASNCQISAVVDNVPYGHLVTTIRLYDADRNLLTGSELVSGFHISELNPVVQISYRQTNVGQVLQGLRGTGQIADEFLAGQLDLDALQTFIDAITGVSGNFPNYTFTTHPALVNIPRLINDLRAQNGDVSALNATDPVYKLTAGSAHYTLEGLLNGDSITASVDDALSADVVINSNGEVTLTNIPPGTWTLRLSGSGYLDQRVSVTVTSGAQTELETLSLETVPPVLTSLSPGSGVNGSSVVITGENFHATAANNTVTFGGVSAVVTAASATSLTVTVPSGVALGTQPVSVAKGTGPATTGLNYTVVRPTLTSLSQTAGEIGSSVTLNGTHFNPTASDNTVKFGSVTVPSGDISVNGAGTQMTVVVPAGIYGSVPVTVSNLQSPESDAQNYAVTPTITALSASTGSSGNTLTLTGNGFDTTGTGNTVRLGTHTLSNVTAQSTTSLQVTLPNVPAGTANATVQVGTQTSAAVAAANFAIVPYLSALTSAAEQDGKAVLIREEILTLDGTNFDPILANNVVKFGALSATPITASSTQLTVAVPGSVGTAGDVSVTVETNTRPSNAITALVPTLNLNFSGGFQ